MQDIRNNTTPVLYLGVVHRMASFGLSAIAMRARFSYMQPALATFSEREGFPPSLLDSRANELFLWFTVGANAEFHGILNAHDLRTDQKETSPVRPAVSRTTNEQPARPNPAQPGFCCFGKCVEPGIWRNPRTNNCWCKDHTPTFNGEMSPIDMIPTEWAISRNKQKT